MAFLYGHVLAQIAVNSRYDIYHDLFFHCHHIFAHQMSYVKCSKICKMYETVYVYSIHTYDRTGCDKATEIK